MRRGTGRVVLAVFGIAECAVGFWAVAFPSGFYRRFPGWGWHWVSASGPYDEHLVRDFGGAIVGLAVVALVCAARPVPALVLATVVGWEAEAVPHLLYHLAHRDLPGGQEAANLLVLALVVVTPLVAAVLLSNWAPRRGAQVTRR